MVEPSPVDPTVKHEDDGKGEAKLYKDEVTGEMVSKK
jgi:hypothetical protein